MLRIAPSWMRAPLAGMFFRMMRRPLSVGLTCLAIACARQGLSKVRQTCNTAGFCTDSQLIVLNRLPPAESEWPSYGRTPYGDRNSPLTQITPGNITRLEVAWRFHTGEGAPEFKTRAPTALEVTPLVFRGTMYLSTPLGRVFALDPTTGTQRWVYDPQIDRTTQFGDFANRGVALWMDGAV